MAVVPEVDLEDELVELNDIKDAEDDIHGINPNLHSVSQLPSRSDFCKPPVYPIVFTPYDIKENQTNGYNLELYGADVGGNKTKVTVTDIPVDFYILVNDKFFGDKPYYDEIHPEATDKIIKLFSSRDVLKNQFLKNIRELMQRVALTDEFLSRDFMEICKTYNVYDVDHEILTGDNGRRLKAMLENGTIELFKCDSDLVSQIGSDNCNCILEPVLRKVMMFYHETPVFCIRVIITSNRDILRLRKRAIKLCEGEGYTTFNNDMSSYYRKASRENDLQLAAVLEVPSPIVSIKDVKKIDESNICPGLVMTFDIETYSEKPSSDVPEGDRPEDHIFMVACTFHWYTEKAPILSVVLTTVEPKASTEWKTVVCPSETELLLEFARLFHRMSPDIVIGFNDTYDWTFIVKKAHMLMILDKMLIEMGEDIKNPMSDRAIKVFAILQKYNMTIDDFISDRHPVEMTDEESEYLSNPYYDVKHVIDEELNGDKTKYMKMIKKLSAQPKYNNLPYIVENAKLFKNKEIKKYFCFNRDKTIKITADEVANISYLKVTGCVSIDVRICFKKLYPKADGELKSNLNSYLAREKLESKDDLPIFIMFRYLREYFARDKTQPTSEQLLKQNRIISRYCLHDAQRCHELMFKRLVYDEFRSVANISYTSFNDSYVGANGAKVRNLTAMRAFHNGYVLNMSAVNTGEKMAKYTGAYVIQPKKGKSPSAKLLKAMHEISYPLSPEMAEKFLADYEAEFEKSRPIAGLDFSSLYPSIMMAYNLSPEKIIKSREELETVKALYNYGDDEFKHYEYDYDGRKYEAWSKKHHNYKPNYGLFPTILLELFAKRKEIKTAEGVLKNNEEELKLKISTLKAKLEELNTSISVLNTEPSVLSTLINEIKSQLKTLNHELEVIESDIRQLNTKQKAVKVFMNTFYGESGNSTSPLFLLQFASGVTTLGQYNLKFVKNFVEKSGYYIKYGDTDSVYISCPNHIFRELDYKFLTGVIDQKQYWHDQIELSMQTLNVFKNVVNNTLKQDNGSVHLTMAYEEILFPVVFTGKKKYYGLAHENVINLDHTRSLFIRGIEIIKSGISPLVKNIGMDIMRESMTYTPLTMLEMSIKHMTKAFNETQDYDLYKLSMAWKPAKKNITAQKFYARMAALGEYLPEPNERFYFVVIKPDIEMYYTITGCKSAIKKSEVMEYFDKAKKLDLPIDKLYYFKNLISICARLSNHDDMFNIADVKAYKNITDHLTEEEELTIKDQEEQKRADKYITGVIEGLFKPDVSKGDEYKKIFKAEYEKVKYPKAFKYSIFLETEDKIRKHFNEVNHTCTSLQRTIVLSSLLKYYEPMRVVSECIHEQLKFNIANIKSGNPERKEYIYDHEIIKQFEEEYNKLFSTSVARPK